MSSEYFSNNFSMVSLNPLWLFFFVLLMQLDPYSRLESIKHWANYNCVFIFLIPTSTYFQGNWNTYCVNNTIQCLACKVIHHASRLNQSWYYRLFSQDTSHINNLSTMISIAGSEPAICIAIGETSPL